MCQHSCRHLWSACDECIEQMFQEHEDHLNHKAVLAHVPASDDEWRRRLDEQAPLVTERTSPQGTSNAKE